MRIISDGKKELDYNRSRAILYLVALMRAGGALLSPQCGQISTSITFE